MTRSAPALVDTHAHMNATAFNDDRDETLGRARAAGVALVLDVGTEPEEWERSLELTRRHADVRCILGLHPNRAELWSAELRLRLAAALADRNVVGVGETGLDYYRLGAPPPVQRRVFEAHLELGRETSLPVVIHARDSYDDVLATLALHGKDTTGVLHSFAGDARQALRAAELGYYVSISGPVTYKSGGNVREVAAAVPLDRLLVETDSPYLPPHPHRGRRNEPAHVALTVAAVAEARGIPPEELALATTANARCLFGLQPIGATT